MGYKIMNVILSIKPKYVEQIINGSKKFEYRKKLFKQTVDKVYIYSTSPEKKIIGYFKYTGYIQMSPYDLWISTSYASGIDKNSFMEYFKKKEIGYALIVSDLFIFEDGIDPHKYITNFVAPQSFMYIEGDVEYE